MIRNFFRVSRIQTLERLKRQNNQEIIQTISFSNLTKSELKQLNEQHLEFLYKKEIARLKKHYQKLRFYNCFNFCWNYSCALVLLTRAQNMLLHFVTEGHVL